MNRAFLKQLLIIPTILLICSGCTQSNIIGDNLLTEQSDSGVVKYKNGAVLLKNNQQYNVTSRNNFDNSKSSVEEVKFGPSNINFGN